MWKEEEFFKDFSEDMEKIKPDAAFVEQLKSLAKEKTVIKLEKQRKRKNLMHYAMAAASVVLCISIGGIGLHAFHSNSTNKDPNNSSLTGEMHAQNEPSAQGGSIQNETGIPVSVISMVEDEQNLLDNQQGNTVALQDRKELAALMKKCVKAEANANPNEGGNIFYCAGEDRTLKIIVYNDYISVDNVLYQITK